MLFVPTQGHYAVVQAAIRLAKEHKLNWVAVFTHSNRTLIQAVGAFLTTQHTQYSNPHFAPAVHCWRHRRVGGIKLPVGMVAVTVIGVRIVSPENFQRKFTGAKHLISRFNKL